MKICPAISVQHWTVDHVWSVDHPEVDHGAADVDAF